MRHRILVSLTIAGMLVSQPAWARNVKAWDDASTVGVGLLVGTAIGLPAVKSDWTGDLQAGGSIGAAFLTTAALKKIFPETRPDRSDRKSFPSSHASVAFAAAASLQNRYGWEVGLPAQAVAAFVGVARVQARKHHWYDVVAGAAIGEASGFLITTRFDENVRVFPWGDSKGGGFLVTMDF